MLSTRTRVRSCLAVLGAVMTFGLLAASVPATSSAAYQVKNVWSGRCLTSDALGNVSMASCGVNNRNQQWERWDGGWTKNVATGLCLTDMSQPDFYYGYVVTKGCDPSQAWQAQYWRSFYGGWFQRPEQPGFPAACLYQETGNPYSVRTTRCVNPSGTHPSDQYWRSIPL